jgi:hypothetical protein
MTPGAPNWPMWFDVVFSLTVGVVGFMLYVVFIWTPPAPPHPKRRKPDPGVEAPLEVEGSSNVVVLAEWKKAS